LALAPFCCLPVAAECAPSPLPVDLCRRHRSRCPRGLASSTVRARLLRRCRPSVGLRQPPTTFGWLFLMHRNNKRSNEYDTHAMFMYAHCTCKNINGVYKGDIKPQR